MKEPKQAEASEGVVDEGEHVGKPNHPATTQPKGQTITLASLNLRIPTSAAAMAAVLLQHADELRDVAEQLKNKRPGDQIILPLCFTLMCNGGGDG